MATLSADKTYVTVQKGDTLSAIAAAYKTESGNKTWQQLADLNDLENANLIYPGQKIKLTGTKTATNTPTGKVVYKQFGLQSDSGDERTVFVTWSFNNHNQTDPAGRYKYRWWYKVEGNSLWFSPTAAPVFTEKDSNSKWLVYTAPSNATQVKINMRPVSADKDSKTKGKQLYFTPEWVETTPYNFSDNPPRTPDVPTVTIEANSLTASLTNIDVNGDQIIFEIVMDQKSRFGPLITANITRQAASCQTNVALGHNYCVRARSYRDGLYSDWSAYSEPQTTIPEAPSGITKLYAESETAVGIDWPDVPGADTYVVEYTKNETYFDRNPAEVQSTSELDASVVSSAHITGLETGNTWYFRVIAKNEKGESSPSPVKYITIGKPPGPPTTWMSTATAMVGETVNLYWVHNSQDGSSEVAAELEIITNGYKQVVLKENNASEAEKDNTKVYSLDTTGMRDSTILWRVRTKGITGVFGEWSTQRTIKVYLAPSLTLEMFDKDETGIRVVDSFPFVITATSGPNSQKPIGYQVTIKAADTYETVDYVGREVTIASGTTVYSSYFDSNLHTIAVQLSAENIDLANTQKYNLHCTVAMDSGLSASAELSFVVSWVERLYEPNMSYVVNEDAYTMFVNPYCEKPNGDLVENIYLSLYRREYDGSFVELAKNIDNTLNTYVVDPHPALDYARYRVVAIDKATGAVSFYDPPGIPAFEKKPVLIQWDEQWTNFEERDDGSTREEPAWSGSMLILPYNIDVSDKHSPDTSLVEYIGREHPVSYYGTQLGVSSTWSVEIPKDDVETLYAIRRLARWMGDVYVREPSGSGYWANIVVSYSQKHLGLTIPIIFDITRVAGSENVEFKSMK